MVISPINELHINMARIAIKNKESLCYWFCKLGILFKDLFQPYYSYLIRAPSIVWDGKMHLIFWCNILYPRTPKISWCSKIYKNRRNLLFSSRDIYKATNKLSTSILPGFSNMVRFESKSCHYLLHCTPKANYKPLLIKVVNIIVSDLIFLNFES